jgi:hypothetical protein
MGPPPFKYENYSPARQVLSTIVKDKGGQFEKEAFFPNWLELDQYQHILAIF